ncbi:MAG: 30S ribosomal protein S12 methylthiotransferase RimO [Firmicutes bacterium]|nr:30S ribosomal protein S12 methylthiotransferase RimO [Bacillota bacterium]
MDTENMLGLLQEAGHVIVPDAADAQGVLVNTCGFIADAAQEAVDTILHYADLKKSGDIRVLVVAGCLVQRYGKDIMEEIPEVDALVGTGDYGRIVEVFSQVEQGGCPACIGDPGWLAPEGGARVVSTPRHFAYIKVSEGCSNRCSYCLIPSLRGPQTDRPMEAIVAEARRLAESGVVEAILVAQDTTAYGRALYGRPRLAELLRHVAAVEGLKWVRVLYTYPSLIDDELIDVFAENRKVLPYLDIPMQHGSDRILRAMRRRITRQGMIDVCAKLRRRVPRLVIRTSLIVGFPGETDRDFSDLLTFIDEVRPERAGVFVFSPEEGADAATFPDQVPAELAAERRGIAMQRLAAISRSFGESRIGAVETVLVDGISTESELLCTARSYAEAPDVDGVIYVGDATLRPGQFVDVRITDAADYDLAAEPV